MFEHVLAAEPDAIFDLVEKYRQDQRTEKINLTAGVYQDEHGQTPIMRSVKAAAQQLLKTETTKSYLGIEGLDAFNRATVELLFGSDYSPDLAARIAVVQTLGGTGALRLASELLRGLLGRTSIAVSQPTWINHPAIFKAVGLSLDPYPYTTADGRGLDFAAMMQRLSSLAAGTPVVLHACCHNPSGYDPTRQQWTELAEVVARRQLLPLFDCAYQGFGESLDDDVWPIRMFTRQGIPSLICYSYSKNVGLYSERVGAFMVVAPEAVQASNVLSQLKIAIRVNWSNPPRHGASLVAAILSDDALRSMWLEELKEARSRVANMRQELVQQLAQASPDHDFSHLIEQRGMFGYAGLSGDQADQLRQQYGIYMLRSGRINIAGITPQNVQYLARAIGQVVSLHSRHPVTSSQ